MFTTTRLVRCLYFTTTWSAITQEKSSWNQWCTLVIFAESKSRKSHKPIESKLSQRHLKFLRFESDSSHDLVESRHSRVTRTVKSLRVIALQARLWWPMPATIKNCCFYHFFGKQTKNVSKTKKNLLSFQKHFRFANIFQTKILHFLNLFSFRKHFHFCLQSRG